MAKSVKSYVNKIVKGEIIPKSRADIPGETSGKGLRYGKCTVCREIFSSVSTFDAHRIVKGRMDNYHRICVDPESVGLILGERGVWIADQERFDSED